ncbi:MAG: [NiFe]-hydrogenase assembly chaperone HybE [Methylomonas sp.]|nr:[NiFe]-hydrogenase assembly chaperone HybE [Methylomonas sp.]
MQWRESVQIERTLEQTFNYILETRMQGIPVVNPALAVEALGFVRANADWVGILITPWFMNLMLLPGMGSDWTERWPGSKFEEAFPYGVFEFTVAGEPQLGCYAQCSLFSPMFQFQNQDDARNAAQAALQALLTPPKLSRRDLLRGNLGTH